MFSFDKDHLPVNSAGAIPDTNGINVPKAIAVAKIHPFYNPDVIYPPNNETVERIRGLIDRKEEPSLQKQPLLEKRELLDYIYIPINFCSRKTNFFQVQGHRASYP